MDADTISVLVVIGGFVVLIAAGLLARHLLAYVMHRQNRVKF